MAPRTARLTEPRGCFARPLPQRRSAREFSSSVCRAWVSCSADRVRGSLRQVAAGLAVALIGFGLVQPPVLAQEFGSERRELLSIEQAIASLKAAPLRGSELRSPTYPEERLTDGELFYRLKDYVRASVVLTDVVERFPEHRVYPDALFLLAESLYEAGDYLGARARYRELLEHSDEPAFRSRLQPALARLIEIAIKIRNFDGIERYFERLERLPPSSVEAATAYFKAKYLYSVAVPSDLAIAASGQVPTGIDQDKLEQARAAFAQVGDTSSYASQAGYFIGVIYTLRGQYAQAIEQFKAVAARAPQDDVQRDVVEQAQLSLGRLYYEADQTQNAIDAYQTVPRTSKYFETALFEITWAYLRQGDSTRAERSLEVLGVAAPDSLFIPDAKILRGNLLLRDGRYAQAGEVFTEVTREFQPVRDELDRQVTNQADPEEFFRELVRRNLDQFDEGGFLPPLAQRWARIESDMRRAVDAVRDLHVARRLTGETGTLLARLQAVLEASNRANMFPELRAQLESSTALRNRLALLRKNLTDAEAERVDTVSPELKEARAKRRALERAVAALPQKVADFQERTSAIDARYLALSQQLSSLNVELLGLDARLVATQFYIDHMLEITPESSQSGLAAYQTEILQQKQSVVGHRDQLAALKIEVESSRLQVGVGDTTFQRDDELRAQYLAAVQSERSLQASLGVRSNADLDGLYQRVSAAETQLDTRDREIDAVAEERTRDMKVVVADESGKLVGYHGALASLNTETEQVVGRISYENYRRVQKRFYDVVLKADLGLVDVGWADREEHRTRIETLTRERARSAQSLDDEFREIMDERGKQ